MTTAKFRNNTFPYQEKKIIILMVGTATGVTEYLYERIEERIKFHDIKFHPPQYQPWVWQPDSFSDAYTEEVMRVQYALNKRIVVENREYYDSLPGIKEE